ncbi:MAG: DTW domain-containing protein [Pseudomonadales bacterium]|nr:DTW domain-containing protein [Pseudomonadales bacterium]
MVKIYLLTHQNELRKTSNTGQLVLQALGASAIRVIWQRAQPDPDFITAIQHGNTALLYPDPRPVLNPDLHSKPSGEDSRHSESTSNTLVGTQIFQNFDQFIILDGTWQEARKMFNRSPYLQSIPRVQLDAIAASNYYLRRNQRSNCCCTAEAVIQLLERKEDYESASRLVNLFDLFLTKHTTRPQK